MIIKEVVIETDNGDTVTVSLDKLEAFFQSVERMKLAADPGRNEREKLANLREEDMIRREQQMYQLDQQRAHEALRTQEVERQAAQARQQVTWNNNTTSVKDYLDAAQRFL